MNTVRFRLLVLYGLVLTLGIVLTWRWTGSAAAALERDRREAGRLLSKINAHTAAPTQPELSASDRVALARAIPAGAGVDELLDDFVERCSVLGFEPRGWEISAEEESTSVGRVSLRFMVTCSADALPALLDRLQRTDRLVLLDGLSVQAVPTEPGMVDVVVRLSAFSMREQVRMEGSR